MATLAPHVILMAFHLFLELIQFCKLMFLEKMFSVSFSISAQSIFSSSC